MEYVNYLKDIGIQISMSRKGNPYDYAFDESFMKTLYEKFKYATLTYNTLEGAQSGRETNMLFVWVNNNGSGHLKVALR